MRILLVSHLFPPSHSAGVEVFASELALALKERGHEVFVLHGNKRIGRKNLSMQRRTWKGLGIFEVINNLFHSEFEETWQNPAIDGLFEEAIREVQPDVVHFHHLMYLSAGVLPLARRHAQAVLFTPHDYFVECAAMGQLVHTDGSNCDEVDTDRCGTCIPNTNWAQGRLERRVGRGLGLLHSLTRLDLGPLARRLAPTPNQAVPRSDSGTPQIDPEVQKAFAQKAQERRQGLRQALLENVGRFLCPSKFLMERMVRFGLPQERAFLCPTGVDLEKFPVREAGERRRRSPDDPVQITFLGTMIPIKGAHLLLEAWGLLPAEWRAKGELSLCGPLEHAPDYVEALREKAGELFVEVHGRLSREKVAQRLLGTDLFVMPSMWFENRPLILHEALALGVPCLVSDAGGMAELVQPGKDGWHFAMGDARALAQRLAAVLSQPDCLDNLEPESPDLCSWDQAAERFEAHYSEVLSMGALTPNARP